MRPQCSRFISIPDCAVPDYRAVDPLLLHIAFDSQDPAADARRIVAAGARMLNDTKLDDGSHLIMLKDPWELAVRTLQKGEKAHLRSALVGKVEAGRQPEGWPFLAKPSQF